MALITHRCGHSSYGDPSDAGQLCRTCREEALTQPTRETRWRMACGHDVEALPANAQVLCFRSDSVVVFVGACPSCLLEDEPCRLLPRWSAPDCDRVRAFDLIERSELFASFELEAVTTTPDALFAATVVRSRAEHDVSRFARSRVPNSRVVSGRLRGARNEFQRLEWAAREWAREAKRKGSAQPHAREWADALAADEREFIREALAYYDWSV